MGRDRGYITLAVLVIAGLLAAFVSTILGLARPAIGLARIGADELAAEGLMDGGLAAAAYLLYKAERAPVSVDRTTLRLATGSVRLGVADEGARIDLNKADEELLSGVFSAVGAKSMDPAAFAARIEDWRDEDSDTGVGGAEMNDYVDAGLAQGPGNRDFRSVSELRRLLGLSEADFIRLEPVVTVFGASGLIDPAAASRTVLLAIPGVTPADVSQLIEARSAGTGDLETLADLLPSGDGFLATEPSGVYRVVTEARLKTGFGAAAEAVMIAGAEEGADYGVVAWTRLQAPGAVQ